MSPARLLLMLAVLLGGCDRSAPSGTMTVSAIGPPLAPGPPPAPPRTVPETVLAASTGLGLVRLDDQGQLAPGLAVRWAVAEDGLDLIMRLDETRGQSAPSVVRRLRATLKPRRGDLMARWFAGIDAPAAVTDQVIEIRLREQRPDILALLASPRLAGLSADGPFAAVGRGAAIMLVPRGAAARPALLRGERAGRAVARFAAGGADLVLGGRFTDLAIARAAGLPGGRLVFDEAVGLFGLAVRARTGAVADPAAWQALALAVDRDRIVAALGTPGLDKATTVAGSTVEPPLDRRRAAARGMIAGGVAGWSPLRVALPDGPGATLLFRLLAADWAAIGVRAVRVADGADADLALVDEVLPAGERARAACAASPACDPGDPHALLAPPFVPIAAPLRWSLVAPRVRGFAENSMAAHPLEYIALR